MQFRHFVENAIQYCNQNRLTYIARGWSVCNQCDYSISMTFHYGSIFSYFHEHDFGMFLENIVLGHRTLHIFTIQQSRINSQSVLGKGCSAWATVFDCCIPVKFIKFIWSNAKINTLAQHTHVCNMNLTFAWVKWAAIMKIVIDSLRNKA